MAKGVAPEVDYSGSSSLGYTNHMKVKHTAENPDTHGYITTSDPSIRYDVNTGEYRRVTPAPVAKAPVAKAPAPVKKTTTAKAPTKKAPVSTKTHAGGTSASGMHYNPDKNANLKEAVIFANEDNTNAIQGFEDKGNAFTNTFLNGSRALTDETRGRFDDAYAGYNDTVRGHLDNMGTADQDIHTRNKGQYYAGVDTGFAQAEDDLMAQMARRGLSNSGAGMRGMVDLANSKARTNAEVGTKAYTDAIDMSDNRRNTRIAGEGTLYGAQLGNINQGYTLGMGNLNQDYSTRMGLEGQFLQNRINNNQQRQSNLMGYSQLGAGMNGMSQNYLANAGTGFGNIGQVAGNTALGVGQLNNSYNNTMQNATASFNNMNQRANTASNAKGADMAGTALGVAGSVAFSDQRLKDNIVKIGEYKGLNVVSWNWNKKAKEMHIYDPTVGFLAQEVQELYPQFVETKEQGYLGVKYEELTKFLRGA